MTEVYISNGRHYDVSQENLERFLTDHPEAKKKEDVDVTVYYTREGDEWKGWDVSGANIEKFKADHPEARTIEEWEKYGADQEAKYNAWKESEKKRKEAAKKAADEAAAQTKRDQEAAQAKHREKIELRFKKEIEALYSPEHNWFSNPTKLKELEGLSYEDKVKWLNENIEDKYEAELSFEEPEFDINEEVVDESQLDIPNRIDIDGIEFEELKNNSEVELGDNFLEQINNYNNSIQKILDNPILDDNGAVDYEATQEAIDEVQLNAPQGLEVRTDNIFKALDEEKENILSRLQQYEDTLRDLGGFGLRTDDMVNRMVEEEDLVLLNRARELIGMSEEEYNDLLENNKPALFKKLKSELETKGGYHWRQLESTQLTLEERKKLLEQYQKGEIDLTTEQLSEISVGDPAMAAYLKRFFPDPEDIEVEPGVSNQEAVLNSFNEAISKAVMADPRFKFVQTNIQKEVDKSANAKLAELSKKYKLDTNPTQENLEKAQEEFAEWYGNSLSEKFQTNNAIKKLYKEYGVAGSAAYGEINQDFLRDNLYKGALRRIDDTMERYSEERLKDSDWFTQLKGKWKRGSAYIRESGIGLVKNKAWWNDLQTAVQQPFLENRTKTRDMILATQDDLSQYNYEGESGDLTVKQLMEILPADHPFVRHQKTWRGTRDNDKTLNEMISLYDDKVENIEESIAMDTAEAMQAYADSAAFKTYHSGKAWYTLEGFLDRTAGLVEQAPHMVPTFIGQALVAKGTLVAATGVGAAPGAIEMAAGYGFMALGASIQGAMEYSSVYMDAVRRKLTEELKREPTVEEYVEALASGRYGDHQAALATGAAVMGTEFLSDAITSKLTGGAGAYLANTSIGRALIGNTFGNYVLSAGTGYAGMKINAYQEWITEGFQTYLGEVADNYIQKAEGKDIDNIFTHDINWEEIQHAADMGYKIGELFGGVGFVGSLSGFNQIQKSYTQKAEDLAANIDMNKNSNTYEAANSYFKKLQKAITEDSSLTKHKKRELINEISRIREAAIQVPQNVTGSDKRKLMKLLIEQRQLKNDIKSLDNKELAVNKIERKAIVDQEIVDIVKGADERSSTIGMSVLPTRSIQDNFITTKSEQAKDSYQKIDNLIAKEDLDLSNKFDQKRILKEAGGTIKSAFDRLYQDGGLLTRKEFQTRLENEYIQALTEYDAGLDINNQGIGQQTSNLFNLRANAVAKENIKQKGDTISMSDEKAPQIGDTTEQTDFDAEVLQETGKREKRYIADNTKVTKAVGEKAIEQIDKETSQEILREAALGEDPEGIAKAIGNMFGQSTARGGRGLFNIIGDKAGTLKKGFGDFIDNVIDRDFIAALPSAYLKQSTELQKILGLKKIGKTQVVKTDKKGKKTYSRPSVFAIPSDISDAQVQQVRDYFKKSTTTREGILKRLTQEFALDSINKLKQDKDFMQKLQTALGDKQNATDFLNEVQAKLDQRTLEDTTRDFVADSKTMKKIIKLLDKGIELVTPDTGNLYSFPPQIFAGIALKLIKEAILKFGKFVDAMRYAGDSMAEVYAVTDYQRDTIKAFFDSLTPEDILVNVEKVTKKLEATADLINKDKYKNVNDDYIKFFKKIRTRKGKVDFLNSFFKNINTSFQKAKVGTRGLWKGQKAQDAYDYWGKAFGVNLKDLGFDLIPSGGGKSIAFQGVKIVTAGDARPSVLTGKINRSYNKGGAIQAENTLREYLAQSNLNAEEAKTFIVEEVSKLLEQGDPEVAMQLLDVMGLESNSALRMVGTIRSIQTNVKTAEYKNRKGEIVKEKRVTYEHTPSIASLREQIKAEMQKKQSISNFKKNLRAILDNSFVDIIDTQASIKLEKLGLKLVGTGINDRISKVVNPKNLKFVEAGPKQLNSDKELAAQKIAKNTPDIVSKKDSSKKIKKTLLQSLETKLQGLKIIKKRKGLSAFDMDDTLALTKEKVIALSPAAQLDLMGIKEIGNQILRAKLEKEFYNSNKVQYMSAAEYAQKYESLSEKGWVFDYRNFDNVDLSTEKGPLAGTALKRQAKYGSKDIYIVTARPNASKRAIKIWADSIGLNIPMSNIVTLEDGSPMKKADWLLSKAEQGYNDFYFADDSAMNVEVVKDILSQIDVKSKVQLAVADKANTIDVEMNQLIEDATGIDVDTEVLDVEARLEGKKRDKGFFKRILRQFKITSSADDFLGLGYKLFGFGKKGTKQQQWFIDNFIKPYDKAEQALISAKVTVSSDFATLKKAFPKLANYGVGKMKNPLNDQIGHKYYTIGQAIRVYLWNKQGMEIPGISNADVEALVTAVQSESQYHVFADNLQLIQKESEYPGPAQYWMVGTIQTDILNGLDTTFRAKLLTEWQENVNLAFSPKHMNKLEKAYGSKYVEALRDALSRMKRGTNRPVYEGSGSRQVNEMMDWLNGSVGVAMFLNVRSGSLQMLSNVNFINWGDNNIYAAAKAFMSKDYVPTVIELMNSDYLVNRREGLKINVNEAELAAAAQQGGFKGMLNYLLDKGFILTRIFDSLAIATGGATFYMNRQKSLLNRINKETGKKYTKAEAQQQAFDDFYAIAEETQQSSNPSKISSQQASMFGRLILSFQNVTMQYNRKAKKMLLDFINRRKRPGMTQRESDLSNLSGVIYYVGMQNLIFNSLQQALFALAFGDEEEKDRDKVADTINGMMDSLLFGLGFGGAIISTVKNVIRELNFQRNKETPKYEEALWRLFDISPVIDAKVRNIRKGLRTFSWDMEEMKKRGWSLDNPAYIAISSIISGFTNIPIDRLFRKINNIRQATDEEVRTYERIALLLGWSGWNFGLPYWGRESTIKREAEEEERLKENFKQDVRKAKAMGFTKRIPFTGKNSWQNGIPKGLKLGVDYIAIERYDGLIQYYKKP